MTKLEELKKYLNHNFISDWKVSNDYIMFQNLYIKYLKEIARKNNWKVIKINKNHYEFSSFLMCNNQIIYFSIPDVRYYKNDWFNKILIRIAHSENDYIGEQNNYCSLDRIQNGINVLALKSKL